MRETPSELQQPTCNKFSSHPSHPSHTSSKSSRYAHGLSLHHTFPINRNSWRDGHHQPTDFRTDCITTFPYPTSTFEESDGVCSAQGNPNVSLVHQNCRPSWSWNRLCLSRAILFNLQVLENSPMCAFKISLKWNRHLPQHWVTRHHPASFQLNTNTQSFSVNKIGNLQSLTALPRLATRRGMIMRQGCLSKSCIADQRIDQNIGTWEVSL